MTLVSSLQDDSVEGQFGVSRRLLLLGLGAAAGTLALPTFGANSSAEPVLNPNEQMRLLLRLMATAGQASVPWFYTGRIYAVRAGMRPLHLFNFEGSEIYWIKPIGVNEWSMAVSTLTFYRDRDTGEYLDRFANPITGKTVEVSANVLRSKPGQSAVYAGQSMIVPGDSQPITMEIHRSAETVWLTTSRSNGNSPQPAMEVNSLFGATAEVDDPRKLSPRANFSSVSLSRWSKWLQMGDVDGHLLWHAAGRKLASLTELPDSYRRRADALKSTHFSNPEDDAIASAGIAPSPPATSAPAPPLAKFSYVVGAGGVPLSVAEIGEGSGPEILLIHGLGQSHLSFRAQLHSSLNERFRLVAFDLRGHGNSGKPWSEAAYSDSRAYAEDVATVMQTMNMKKPLILAWSYGTLVTADYIRHYGTEKISGVVMIGALGGLASLPPGAFDPKVMAAMQQLHQLAASPGLEDTLRASHDVVPLLTSRPMPREWTATSETAGALVPPFARNAMGARMSVSNTDLIERIRIPMWLTAGSEDKGTPKSLMQSLSARLPQAQFKVYEECGHSPFAEDPDQFNQDLTAFCGNVFAAART